MQAAELYTKAIDAADSDSELLETLYSNRAACYLKTNDWLQCAQDATACLKLNADNSKALWRRAQAMQEMHRLDAALSDLIRLLSCKNLKSKTRDTYAKRARELKDHMEGVSTSGKDDPALTALNLLRDETKDFETKNVQLHKIGSAMEDHMWACRVVQRGGLDTMWKLLEDQKTCSESLACLAKIAAHSDLNRVFFFVFYHSLPYIYFFSYDSNFVSFSKQLSLEILIGISSMMTFLFDGKRIKRIRKMRNDLQHFQFCVHPES